jgi:hypothetical protein
LNRSDTPTATVEPVISSFRADPPGITTGEETTLKWTVTGAESVSINQGIGNVDASGSRAVSPTDTTTYTLTATNSIGSVNKTATVIVAAEGVPQIIVFDASSDNIDSGQSSTLEWNVSGATSISIDKGIGTVDAVGTTQVSPTVLTTYTLTATNSYGSVTASVTVFVTSAGGPVITFFTADPETITEGQDSTLEWEVVDATSVTINNGIDEVSSSGTEVVSPTTTTTYTLTATNSEGTSTETVTVTVSSSSLPQIILFTADPATITSSEFTTLYWIVMGATSVSIDQGVGDDLATSDEQIVFPASTTTYTITATNANGTVTETTTVTVN